MNLLDLKRKTAGWHARGTGDGTDGAGDGTNNGGDSNQGPTGGNYGGGGGGSGGWNAARDSQAANVSAPAAPTQGYNPNASPSSNPAAATHDLISTTGEYSPGVSYGELRARQSAGFGGEDAPGNPGQTVDQALAAKTFHDFANDTVPAVAMGFVSGVSPALGAALRLAMATQNNTLGETTGSLLGSLTGTPMIGSVGALLGRSFDTGIAPTTKDFASVGWKSVAGEVSKKMSEMGYSAAGPIGAKLAGSASIAAMGSIGRSIGASASGSKTSSTTGGTR